MNSHLNHHAVLADRAYEIPSPEPQPIRAARAMLERDFPCLLKQEPHVLELALKEAEALAWETGVPELVLLSLAEEKAAGVALWHDRQESLRHHGQIRAFAE